MADEGKVEFPEREDDGCTYCGMVLSVTNRDGSFNVEASEAAQRAHQNNTGCQATPNYVDPTTERKIDPKTGRLDGEYDPAWKRPSRASAETASAGGGS